MRLKLTPNITEIFDCQNLLCPFEQVEQADHKTLPNYFSFGTQKHLDQFL